MVEIPDKQLLRPDEVARLFDVTLQTVYNWCEAGVLEGMKIGGVLRITRESIVRKIN
jgi:excisionase family DNA binding protein